ncbi:uncharacterized protein PV06_02561 [Exophiala oligosperma]|uniref:Uncharacterized protein n=1 Tax=Exophiala oligosperma TaxID=215243 RepID=A0A0D2B3Z3_9EURO|nr:uncharacterized protein PV06_02561 [Exophiala oligosperma]KIW46941.1 hypothetical protein PV06_02561 [Exophiala oligosperma]
MSKPYLGIYCDDRNWKMGTTATQTRSLPLPTRQKCARAADTIPTTFTPSRGWRKLPATIFELILQQLRELHFDAEPASCATCFMRDLCAVQRTCKAWFSDAQRMLYTHIELIGQDDPRMLRKWRLSRAARLVRLRATLRARPRVAALVRTLRVADPHIPLYLFNDDPNPEYDAYLCTLSSVIMACPNLEALLGFSPFYNHTFDRLTHALSTRTKLRQHVWVIAENEDVKERSQKQLPPGLLDSQQTFEFILYHDRWQVLETLMLCSPGGFGVVEHEVFIEVLHALPSLKNFCVSSFDVDDFNDKTLLSLPSLVSVRLEECVGVTDSGLTRWAGSPRAAMIERLSLIHQNVTNLLTLSKIFASLDKLKRFTLVQVDVVPTMPDDMSSLIFQPIMASKSLQFMHWDVGCSQDLRDSVASESSDFYPHHGCSESDLAVSPTPNHHLALSIVHSGFPALTKLRAPRDTSPRGILQSACRPPTAKQMNDLERDVGQQVLGRSSPPNSLRSAKLRAALMASDPLIEQSISKIADLIDGTRCVVPSTEIKISRRSSDKEVFCQGHKGDDAVSWSNGECCCERVRRVSCTCDHIADPQTLDTLPPPPPPRSPLRRRFPSLNRTLGTTQNVSSYRSAPDSCVSHAITSGETNIPSTRPNRPILYLEPDLPGHDDNGGLTGWAELLGINEKAKSEKRRRSASTSKSSQANVTQEGEDESVGMCTGAWNSRVRVHGTESVDIVAGSPISWSPGESQEWKGKLATRGKGSQQQKSSSSLSLSSTLKAESPQARVEKNSHVPRPRGRKGGFVMVDDFF